MYIIFLINPLAKFVVSVHPMDPIPSFIAHELDTSLGWVYSKMVKKIAVFKPSESKLGLAKPQIQIYVCWRIDKMVGRDRTERGQFVRSQFLIFTASAGLEDYGLLSFRIITDEMTRVHEIIDVGPLKLP